ncbi:MAG: hypothetical protein MHM6MM_002927 [Cercozoa sp. M6MM]
MSKNEIATVEYTINLHKRLHAVTFKKKAPRAIKAIKEFAKEKMGTEDNRVDQEVNKFIWSKGIRNVPRRIRVRLCRRREEADGEEEAASKLYTDIKLVHVESFKGLVAQKVDDEETE